MMLESLDRQNPGSLEKPKSNLNRQRPSIAQIEVATLLMNAKVLRKAGESQLALNLLREASNRESKNPIVLKALVELLEECGRDAEVLKVREALAKIDYGFESVFGQAQALYKTGDDDGALNFYYEALSLISSDNDSMLFEIHKNLGNIHVRRGDFDGAEEWYNKAHISHPESDALMVNFGTLEVQRGDLGRSLQCFRRAVEINPKNDRAWAGLAMVHHEFGDFELAWGNIERAIDHGPKNRTAVLLAGRWALRDKCPHRAISRLQEFLSSGEFDEEISLILVNLFCLAGHLDLALLESERVLAWNPGQKEVRELCAKIRAAQETSQ